MIVPVLSLIIALRLPFTATFDSIPSFAALPRKKFSSRPSNLSVVLSRVLTSAKTGAAASATSGTATSAILTRRLIRYPPNS
jgi:hypothetical protein